MQIKFTTVEGKQLLDPRSIGRQHRRFGYERKIEGEKFVLGKKEPRVRFAFVGGNFVADETPDHYFRRAIQAGDIDYVATIVGGAEKRDPSLVAVTARNVAAREAATELAATHAAAAEAHDAAALDAAERGADLT